MFNSILLRINHKTMVVFAVVVLCLISSYAMAESQFSWLPNPETDVAGYKILYGQSDGGPYPNVVDVGKPSLVNGRIYGEVSGLQCGVDYYLVCVAYNSQRKDSAYSNQVMYRIPDVPPETPSDLSVSP